MLPPKVRAVYIKELRDALRDRRVVLASVIVPLMIYPLMMLGMSEVLTATQTRMLKETYTVAVPRTMRPFFEHLMEDAKSGDNLDDVPGFGDSRDPLAAKAKMLREANKPEVPNAAPMKVHTIPLTFVEMDADEAGKKLATGEVKAVVDIPLTFEEDVEANKKVEVNVRIDAAEHRSVDAASRVQALMERYSKQALKNRLKAHNMDVKDLQPFAFVRTNVADAAKVGGSLLSFLPMMFIIMIITGAMYPAIDMTAGEKERSTLETLIVTPVRPIEIITGKFLAVATIASATAGLNVLSCGGSFLMMPIPMLNQAGIPWQVLPLALLLLIPLTFFFAALLLAVASFATNHKEAGIYCMPVFMIPIVGMVMVMMPDVELDGPLLFAPVVNVALMIKELFLRHATAEHVVFVFFSTCFYAAGAVALAARVFAREEVLFNAQGSVRLFLSRKFFKPSDRPRWGDAMLVAALLFPINFYFQLWLQKALLDFNDVKVPNFVLVVALPLYLLFLGMPIFIAWYLKLDLKKTFQWNAPPIRAVIGAILLGVSSFFIAQQLAVWQSWVWPTSSSGMEALEKPIHELSSTSWGLTVLIFLIGFSPALCEEHFFRGFLQQGLLQKSAKWRVLLLVGFIFGAFHVPLYRQPIVMLLGVVLAYMAYEAKSLWPGVIYHFMHNSSTFIWPALLGVKEEAPNPGEALPNLPLQWMVPAVLVFAVGLALIRAPRPKRDEISSADKMATAAGN